MLGWLGKLAVRIHNRVVSWHYIKKNQDSRASSTNLSDQQMTLCELLIFFFFGQAHGIQKFPGKESNPCHSSDQATAVTGLDQ